MIVAGKRLGSPYVALVDPCAESGHPMLGLYTGKVQGQSTSTTYML